MTSLADRIRREATELPLKDAAYELWRYRHNLDDDELPPRKFVPLPDDPLERARHMQTIGEQIRHDHDFAHDGPTFDRLKRAQPAAADADIKAAIKAAVKLMDDCEKYFDRDYRDFSNAIDDALAKATRANPGFLATTYRSAGSHLLYVMK